MINTRSRGSLGTRRSILNLRNSCHGRWRRARNAEVRCVAETPTGVQSTVSEAFFHVLPSGLKMEVIVQKPTCSTGKPPLLFLHGSYHAAWCWKEHFLPYFSERGYDSYAVSFRGQGESDVPEGAPAGLLEEHTKDVQHLLDSLQIEPVMFGHSFGGLVAQQYASQDSPPIKAMGLLNSVPPSGNQEMIMRYLVRTPMKSLRITYSFVTQAFTKDPKLCQETFFSSDLPKERLRYYMDLLKTSSKARLLDLKALRNSVPIAAARAPMPTLVLGGEDDAVVDLEGLEETAIAHNTEAVLLPRMAHDCMLDTRWMDAADAILAFLEDL